jgi:hypothetical protein
MERPSLLLLSGKMYGRSLFGIMLDNGDVVCDNYEIVGHDSLAVLNFHHVLSLGP